MIIHLLILIALLHASDCYGLGANSPEKFITPASTTTCSLTAQDFSSGWTETDTGSDFTFTSSTITFTTNPTDSMRLSKSFSATPLDEDFTIRNKVRFSNVVTNAKAYVMVVSQSIPATLYNFTDDHAYVQIGSNGTRYFRLGVMDGGTVSEDGSNFAPALDTDYYLTFKRFDALGTNSTGLYKLEIRTGSHTGTLVDTLVRDADTAEQNDFTYVYAFSNWETETGSYSVEGTVSDMEVGLCAD